MPCTFQSWVKVTVDCIYTPMTLHIQLLSKYPAPTKALYQVSDKLQLAAPTLPQDHLRSFPHKTSKVNPTPHPIHHHGYEQPVLLNAPCLALAPVLKLVPTI
jgi:hypothetical protein